MKTNITKLTKWSLLILVFGLAACGGGGDSDPAPAPAPAPSPTPTPTPTNSALLYRATQQLMQQLAKVIVLSHKQAMPTATL